MAIQINIDGVYFHPNTSFEFTAHGMYIRVSLAIPKKLIKYMAAENIAHSGNRKYYALRSHIPSVHINKNNIEATQRRILNNLMTNIRKAKIIRLNVEITAIKRKEAIMFK